MRSAAILFVVLATACGEGGGFVGEPVTIALLAPKSGALAGVGVSFELVATVAVDSINDKGGIEGRELQLIVEDTTTAPDLADDRLRDVVARGAVAAVGPATSGQVERTFPVAAELQAPVISPSSTAAYLSGLDVL